MTEIQAPSAISGLPGDSVLPRIFDDELDDQNSMDAFLDLPPDVDADDFEVIELNEDHRKSILSILNESMPELESLKTMSDVNHLYTRLTCLVNYFNEFFHIYELWPYLDRMPVNFSTRAAIKTFIVSNDQELLHDLKTYFQRWLRLFYSSEDIIESFDLSCESIEIIILMVLNVFNIIRFSLPHLRGILDKQWIQLQSFESKLKPVVKYERIVEILLKQLMKERIFNQMNLNKKIELLQTLNDRDSEIVRLKSNLAELESSMKERNEITIVANDPPISAKNVSIDSTKSSITTRRNQQHSAIAQNGLSTKARLKTENKAAVVPIKQELDNTNSSTILYDVDVNIIQQSNVSLPPPNKKFKSEPMTLESDELDPNDLDVFLLSQRRRGRPKKFSSQDLDDQSEADSTSPPRRKIVSSTKFFSSQDLVQGNLLGKNRKSRVPSSIVCEAMNVNPNCESKVSSVDSYKLCKNSLLKPILPTNISYPKQSIITNNSIVNDSKSFLVKNFDFRKSFSANGNSTRSKSLIINPSDRQTLPALISMETPLMNEKQKRPPPIHTQSSLNITKAIKNTNSTVENLLTYCCIDDRNNMVTCKICCEQFENLQSFRMHVPQHGRMFVCEYCQKIFPNRYKLNRHITCHTGERPFHCTECPKRFTRTDKLREHIKAIHLKQKKYTEAQIQSTSSHRQPNTLIPNKSNNIIRSQMNIDSKISDLQSSLLRPTIKFTTHSKTKRKTNSKKNISEPSDTIPNESKMIEMVDEHKYNNNNNTNIQVTPVIEISDDDDDDQEDYFELKLRM
ncbi:ATP-dependent RNA helicase [Sarcoptes scabiei]|nr:ATP-dependent RNA helicase [Sarcoptes scabiei]